MLDLLPLTWKNLGTHGELRVLILMRLKNVEINNEVVEIRGYYYKGSI